MNKKKWIILSLLMLFMIFLSGAATANEITPFASEEIVSASVSLSSGKKVVYNIILTSSNYTVRVNYCNLYKENDNGSWTYIDTNSAGVPGSTQGNMSTSCSLADYISTGKYQVRVSITSGNTTRYMTATRTY